MARAWSRPLRDAEAPLTRPRPAAPGQPMGSLRAQSPGGRRPPRAAIGRIEGQRGAHWLPRRGFATFKPGGRASGRRVWARGGHGLAEHRPRRQRRPSLPEGSRARRQRRPRLRPQQAAAGAGDADDVRRPRHLRLPGVRQPLQVDRDHQRGCGDGVRGAEVQAVLGVPQRVPLQRPHRQVPHPLLPPQRGPPGKHLPGHPQGQVVGLVRRPDHLALHPEPAGRTKH